jgi:UDP-N-acetylglucosamine 2-epimerase (non-hydrolysing)
MANLIKILSKKELRRKVGIVVGTRPGIIKMAPLYHEAKRCRIPPLLIHTGQHFSLNMDKSIIKDCDLPKPDFRIIISENERTHARQTAKMMIGIEDILFKEKPRLVLVCGDANTNLAAALAARKLQISVGHIESGLRSYDWRMPEEHNRVMIDHISDLLFAPTNECKQNLLHENVRGKVYVVGNTIVEAVLKAKEKSMRVSKILEELGLTPDEYALVTLHREESVDNIRNCRLFTSFLGKIRKTINRTLVYPIHPRSKIRFRQYGLWSKLASTVKVIEPCTYLDFINLEKNAHIIITDSGGLQEEACILGVPCFTVRENTERWETVKVGSNHIVGFDTNKFNKAYASLAGARWHNPFGKGDSSKKIFEIIREYLKLKKDLNISKGDIKKA